MVVLAFNAQLVWCVESVGCCSRALREGVGLDHLAVAGRVLAVSIGRAVPEDIATVETTPHSHPPLCTRSLLPVGMS